MTGCMAGAVAAVTDGAGIAAVAPAGFRRFEVARTDPGAGGRGGAVTA